MARSSYEQNSFLGGEWSPYAQGRSGDPKYGTAMKVCLNNIPMEEGACVRRSGTSFIIPTRGRTYANILPFDGSATCSFAMEFTNDALRLITQSSVIFDNEVYTIDTMTPASPTVTLSSAPGWSNGDMVMLSFPDVNSTLYPYPIADMGGLLNRVLLVSGISGASLWFTDDLGNDVSSVGYTSATLVGAQIQRIKVFTTTYTGVPQLSTLRSIQAQNQAVILSSTVAPNSLFVTTEGTLSADPVFEFTSLSFIDGPYLDPSGDTATVSGYTGTITVTASTTTPFSATDVGRQIRLFSQPPLWAAGTGYTAGEFVTDAIGAWWEAIASSTGVTPGTLTISGGTNTVVWVPAPTAGTWAWGTISAYTSTSEVSVVLDATIPGMVLNSANGTTMTLFQLGVFSATTGYPACGAYHEGRLWLSGCVPNRFDASTSNGLILYQPSPPSGTITPQVVFSPTDPNGNVLDSNGISEVLNSKHLDQIQWMSPISDYLVSGTLSGEFPIRASALDDPITPTSIQAHMATKYGSLNIEPVDAGMALMFAQKYGRQVEEYVADAFSGRFTGRPLNKDAKHLAASGLARLAYQEELTPTVWALMNNGMLAGCTYRRYSRFVTEEPTINGWHWHLHGGGRIFTSMCTVPAPDSNLDRLFLVSNDPVIRTTGGGTMPGAGVPPNNFFVTVMQPTFQPSDTILSGRFVDEQHGFAIGASLTDCGGANAFTFSSINGTASTPGADSVTPVLTDVPPYPNLPAAGSTSLPPVGNGYYLGPPAVRFDGNTALYGLPLLGSDQTSMSMSVWVASDDLAGLSSGALFSSPALNADEGGTKQLSAVLTGSPATDGLCVVACDGGGSAGQVIYPLDFSPYTGATWAHVMISIKSNGDGSATCLMYVNDTEVIANVSKTALASHGGMWPFSTEPGGIKPLGIAVWTIGGTNIIDQEFTDGEQVVTLPSTTIQLQSVVLDALLQALSLNARGPSIGQYDIIQPRPPAPPIVVPFTQTVQNSTIQYDTVPGIGNIPGADVTGGGSNGFIGSVAEMWMTFGTYIDWTNSTNRYKFHSKDSTTAIFFPVALGATGSVTGAGTPYLYCTGDQNQFPLNRVTGKMLTVSGELADSDVQWPPQS